MRTKRTSATSPGCWKIQMANASPKYRMTAMGTASTLMHRAVVTDQEMTPALSLAPYAWLPRVSWALLNPYRFCRVILAQQACPRRSEIMDKISSNRLQGLTTTDMP